MEGNNVVVDWDDGDRFSFDDSERFEEESMYSGMSDTPESVYNWRGWKKSSSTNSGNSPGISASNVWRFPVSSYFGPSSSQDGQGMSLVELASKEVACNVPFEIVEHTFPPVPEELQLRIAFWSFPDQEDDIRLYSCLANGSVDEFLKGETLLRNKAVKDMLQIGFHLSATVSSATPSTTTNIRENRGGNSQPASKSVYNVAVTFDRKKITTSDCSCSSSSSWCCHVIAVCLYRIHQPISVMLRAPVSESLERLDIEQLKKFARYLISELPQQILPVAQRLLDELLSSPNSDINTTNGAPDPTTGGSADVEASWSLNQDQLHQNIRKILTKFCGASAIVFADPVAMTGFEHPAAAEWTALLRPLRGREPEGIWNLLSIVREMFGRRDQNAISLLTVLTEEVLSFDQTSIWWFATRVSLHSGLHGNRVHSNSQNLQHACSAILDEIVVLWRLACLNPGISQEAKTALFTQIKSWHFDVLGKISRWKSSVNARGGQNQQQNQNAKRRTDFDFFTGFKPALEACVLDWDDFPIPGLNARGWICHQTDQSSSQKTEGSLSSKEQQIKEILRGRGRSVEVAARSEWRINVTGSLIPSPGSHSSSQVNQSSCISSSSSSSVINDAPKPSLLEASASNTISLETNSSSNFCDNVCKDNTSIQGNDVSFEDSHAKSPEDGPSTSGVQEHVPPVDSSRSSFSSEGFCDESEGPSLSTVKVDELEDNSAKKPSQDIPKEEQRVAVEVPPAISLPGPSKGRNHNKNNSRNDPFDVNVKKIEDKMEILFARAEALHVHGYTREACRLAVLLVEEMLANPQNLTQEVAYSIPRGKKAKRFNPASHKITVMASATLSKVAFLCSVLTENPENHYLAFRIGIFGLEMARPPASTKALEVKLANQEQDLVSLLKKIPLTSDQLDILREKGCQLRDGKLWSRGDALLPLTLAQYIFDCLILSVGQVNKNSPAVTGRLPSDESIGFEAAVAALGLKANVSEADHPLLCEGTRRQRGELAVTLLIRYKDDQVKLNRIMEKILDPEVHQMFKNAPPSKSDVQADLQPGPSSMIDCQPAPPSPTASTTSVKTAIEVFPSEEKVPGEKAFNNEESLESRGAVGGLPAAYSASQSQETIAGPSSERRGSDGEREISPPVWDEGYKQWEARFRCTNLKTLKKHSVGMASIDSSAPETTSSDNSPTVVRRSLWMRTGMTGPPSDSGSSGDSSDSFGSSSSDRKKHQAFNSSNNGAVAGDANSLIQKMNNVSLGEPGSPSRNINRGNVSSVKPNIVNNSFPNYNMSAQNLSQMAKSLRFRGKKSCPSIPNQPSEASAEFMFNLAKCILTKAGGSSTQEFNTANGHRRPHPALHMCAFRIYVYSLGLHNAVSSNWLSRTYSAYVDAITQQAEQIGAPAIEFLLETWEGHLTPSEVCHVIAQCLTISSNTSSRKAAAAKLALSCLPHAQALTPIQIHNAMDLCKGQSNEILEQACLAVEAAAKRGGGVYPEVLFEVARKWFEMYEESLEPQSASGQRDPNSRNNKDQRNRNNVQASIGEFQVPIANQQGMDLRNPMEGPAFIQQNMNQAAVNLPVMPIPAANPYAIAHNSQQNPYPYAFFPGMQGPFNPVPTSMAMGIHPGFIQQPLQYPYYPNVTATTTALVSASASLPGLRNMMPHNAVFAGQPLLSNVSVVTQAAAIAQQAYSRSQMMPGMQGPHPLQLPFAHMQRDNHHLQQFYAAMGHAIPVGGPSPPVAPTQQLSQRQLTLLLSTYRVGMLAMETLARRVHDDRPQTRYSRNPSYGEDVKWLLGVAKKLGKYFELLYFPIFNYSSLTGNSYFQDFCLGTVNAVASPFILYDIVVEAAQYLSSCSTTPNIHPFRSHIITPLIQKCQQM